MPNQDMSLRYCVWILETLRACLQGGRVTLASGLTLAIGQKIARVYKQNFTGRVTLQPGTTKCAVMLKLSGNN